MTKKIWLGMILTAMAGTAMAADYEITVEVDETTGGDLEMIETFLDTGTDDSIPSKSLRRVLMAGVGEVAAAADARFDATGNLTLDDGSVVSFMDEDVLKVRRKKCLRHRTDGQCGNATILFKCHIKGNFHRKCQPAYVQVCPEAGGAIQVFVPPARSKGGVRVCTPNSIKCHIFPSCIVKH